MLIEFWADEYREEGLVIIPLSELIEKFDADTELLTDVDSERTVVEFDAEVKAVSVNDRTTTAFGTVASVIVFTDNTDLVFGTDEEGKAFVYATSSETYLNKIIPDEEVYLSSNLKPRRETDE